MNLDHLAEALQLQHHQTSPNITQKVKLSMYLESQVSTNYMYVHFYNPRYDHYTAISSMAKC